MGTGRRDGDHVLVDVQARCSGDTASTPRIVARLHRTGQRWIFANTVSPQRSSDLLKDLDELRRQRDSAR